MPDYTVRDPQTGRTITMRGPQPPTGDQIRRAFAQLPTQPAQTPQATPSRVTDAYVGSTAGMFGAGTPESLRAAGDVPRGVAKGAASTAIGVADLANNVPGVSSLLPQASVDRARAAVQPQNAGERFGFGLEQTAELLLPATRVARLTRGASLPARIAAESGTAAGVTAAQTGGDVRSTAAAAGLGAASPVVAGTASAVGRAAFDVLPERLYQQIFRLAETDLRKSYQALARGGTPNPTLARQALERGIAGNSEQMAVYSLQKLGSLEQQLQQRAARSVMVMPEKAKYIKLLTEIEEQFGSGFFSRQADEAKAMREALEKMPGSAARATDMLATRRLLDGLRNTTSFRTNPVLGPRQEELKVAADQLRGALRRKPELAELIGEERIVVQAVDAIVDDAVRRGNRSVFGLMDAALSSAGTGGVMAAGAVRGAQMPGVMTRLAQGLHRTGQALPPAGSATRATIAALNVGTRN